MSDHNAEPVVGTDRYSASTADLIHLASEQISQLVHQEMRLARMEMTRKGKRAGIGAGLLGGAGVLAFFGGGAATAMVILLLALVMPAWAAALVTAALLFGAAGVAALIGRKQVREVGPLIPENAARSASADVHTVVQAAKGGNGH